MTSSPNGDSRHQPLSQEALKKMLHKQALAEMNEHLISGESAVIVIEGHSGQAFIVTNRHRVLVFKRGMMGGVAFGRKMHSWDFSQIKGITIDVRIVNGFAALELIESNVEELSYWGHGDNDVWRVSNAIPLNTSKEKEIRESAAALRRMLHDFHNPPSLQSEMDQILPSPAASMPKISQLPRDVEPKLESIPVRFCLIAVLSCDVQGGSANHAARNLSSEKLFRPYDGPRLDGSNTRRQLRYDEACTFTWLIEESARLTSGIWFCTETVLFQFRRLMYV